MKVGVIADDFTGASDIALTLAEGGMRVAQFNGVPSIEADRNLDAGVVALKSRTAPVTEAVSSSLAACSWLKAQGATQIILKVCSTFDSTPQGNIGPVLDHLAKELCAGPVPVCPAFPENGRSVYQGHLFVKDKLLSESGMAEHPLTPMKDADLRRVLRAQSRRPVTHISTDTVSQGSQAIEDTLRGKAHFIVDAINEKNLIDIGRAAKHLPLLCGGSGIALGLPGNFGATAKPTSWNAVHGKAVVISGSCSRASRAQVQKYIEIAPYKEITAQDAIAGLIDFEAIADWVIDQDAAPLVYSSADPEVVHAAQTKFGLSRAADAIEAAFARLASILAKRGVKRFVIAGGETSGAVTKGLELNVLSIGPRAASGVPLMKSNGLALALKSGNFGGPNFFAETLSLMELDV